MSFLGLKKPSLKLLHSYKPLCSNSRQFPILRVFILIFLTQSTYYYACNAHTTDTIVLSKQLTSLSISWFCSIGHCFKESVSVIWLISIVSIVSPGSCIVVFTPAGYLEHKPVSYNYHTLLLHTYTNMLKTAKYTMSENIMCVYIICQNHTICGLLFTLFYICVSLFRGITELKGHSIQYCMYYCSV